MQTFKIIFQGKYSSVYNGKFRLMKCSFSNILLWKYPAAKFLFVEC